MNIVIVSHYALPHQGGVETLVDQLSRRLSARGHTVTHLSSNIGSPDSTTQAQDDPSIIHVTIPALNFLEKYAIPYPIFNIFRLYRALRLVLQNADAINVQGMLYMDCVLAAWMGRRRKIPVILTEYPGIIKYDNTLTNFVEKLAFRTLGRFTARNSDCLVVINERVAKELQPFLPSEMPVIKINVGVDTTTFAPATPSQKAALRQKWGFTKFTVLFVGRFVFRKGIDLLTEINSEQFELVICGRGTPPPATPNMRFLGFVSEEELLEVYQASDLFLLLTDGDDFPLVGLEAVASGLPVVAIDTVANREYLDETMAVFAERTPQDLLVKIHALIADRTKHEQIALSARERAVAYFDWEHTVQAYLDLYEGRMEDSAVKEGG